MSQHIKKYRAGDLVEVLAYEDIKKTLDEKGASDGLPFMPEMQPFCGRHFRITKVVHHVCIEGDIERSMQASFLLADLRCDGIYHDGCKRQCGIMWKSAWIKKVSNDRAASFDEGKTAGVVTVDFPVKYEQRYFCQSTEFKNATSEIPESSTKYQLQKLVREFTYKNQKLTGLIANFTKIFSRKLLPSKNDGSCKTLIGDNLKTPSESLDLKVGERVRVKSEEEIKKTLDAYNNNRGLGFSPDMYEYIGRELVVKERLTKMILENTGQMLELKNTVLLEGTACEGNCTFPCGRSMYHFWREIWLERV